MEGGIVSDTTPIRVFVSHLFEKHPDYLRVIEYLESRDNFLYLATSDPDRIPSGGKEDMKEELRNQIRQLRSWSCPFRSTKRIRTW